MNLDDEKRTEINEMVKREDKEEYYRQELAPETEND